MKKPVTKYYILLLLALMFAAPGIAAYVFYHHPSWLGVTKVNKGTLLTPAPVLDVFDKEDKWRLVFLSPDACDQLCLHQLDILARVRLALGRKLYQVDEWLLLGDKSSSISEESAAILKKQDVHFAQLSTAQMVILANLPAEANIFIVNPEGYLILSYRAGVNPDDVYKDLKLLLNTTEHKSG